MTQIFAELIDDLFGDPDYGLGAVWNPHGAALPCRVILRTPDAEAAFGGSRFNIPTAAIEVRSSEVPAPQKGDVVAVGAVRFTLTGEPSRQDADRRVWSCAVTAEP